MSYTEVHLRKTLLPVVTWRLPRDHDTSLARAVARSTEHKSQHAPAGTGYGLWHSSTSNCVWPVPGRGIPCHKAVVMSPIKSCKKKKKKRKIAKGLFYIYFSLKCNIFKLLLGVASLMPAFMSDESSKLTTDVTGESTRFLLAKSHKIDCLFSQ